MVRYIFLFFLTLTFVAHTSEINLVQQVNEKVAAIQEDISSGDLAVIEIKEILDSEGSPPEFKFYYNQDDLVAVHVNVGHETWLVKYSYYFYPNGFKMKLVEEIVGRPDNPPKKAILYDKKGKVLWSSTDKIKVAPNKIKNLFNHYYKLKNMFRGY